jgi:hypothetical protein
VYVLTSKNSFALARICAAGMILAAGASAATVFDAPLASPNTNAATSWGPGINPSWYNGTSSNPQGGFTVDAENGIELGLRAKYRSSPTVLDEPNNVYYVNAGDQIPGRALWNYDYSIDLEPNGLGTLNFSEVTVSLAITDVTQSTSETVNPLNGGGYVADDSGFGTTNGTTLANRDTEVAADWGAQNSENPAFANFLSGYNSGNPDLYEFTLTVTPIGGGAALASDTIFVQVIPEPSTIALFATAGLLFLFLFRRRIV